MKRFRVRLLPKDQEFFKMFALLASRITAASKLLHLLFKEPDRMALHVAEIKQLEHEADNLTRDVIARIDTSFITPIDREDIHRLASRLDDVIDLIDGTARRAQMFRICEVRQSALDLTEMLVRASEAIEGAVTSVKKPRVVVETNTKVKRLEEEADAIYHDAMGRLFEGDPNPLDVIKWKELYDTLEHAMDQCEDVANTLESISLKNS
jgi:predicted phosphate transport protein (TIGR00153 family)